MKPIGYVLVFAVGILNVALNVWAKKAAGDGRQYFGSLGSTEFRIAFVVGLCSVACLVGVYVSGINLSRGILLMGATSIVGGTLFGVVVVGEKMTMAEWGILSSITALYVYRMARGFFLHT